MRSSTHAAHAQRRRRARRPGRRVVRGRGAASPAGDALRHERHARLLRGQEGRSRPACSPPSRSLDGQNGVLVLHGARVVGLDLVSRAPQYAELHDKLLRSYAFEALVRGGEPGDRPVAEAFLERDRRRCRASASRAPASAGTCASRAPACSARRSSTGAAPCTPPSSTSAAPAAPRTNRRPTLSPSWRIADARERARRRQAPATLADRSTERRPHGPGQARQGLQGRGAHHARAAQARCARAGARPRRRQAERRGRGRRAATTTSSRCSRRSTCRTP